MDVKRMLLRTMRGDVEGYYRWHWLLCDSLEIYFDIKGIHYYGPKKQLHFYGRKRFRSVSYIFESLVGV